MLTQDQQDLANKQAELAVTEWEQWYEGKDIGLDQEVGRQGVFQWHP
jgi:NOL1/NOP2/fmu family ribosome biogenesis protein